jgi:hypothetical protein
MTVPAMDFSVLACLRWNLLLGYAKTPAYFLAIGD